MSVEKFFESWSLRLTKISARELATWLGNLALMQRAGVDLVRCLEILESQEPNKRLQNITHKIFGYVHSMGQPVSTSCAYFPRVFPPEVLLLMHAGEQSGDFSGRMEQAAKLLEKQYTLNNKIRSAVATPAITLGSCLVLVFVIVSTILPKFLAMFNTMHTELPLITRMVVVIVNLVTSPVFGFGVVSIFLFMMFYWESLKQTSLGIMMYIPVTRRFLGSVLAVRFCDIVARLYEDGVPLTAALDMLSKTEGFHYHARVLRLVCNQFLQDGRFALAVATIPYFPRVVLEMLLVGEETGALTVCLLGAGRLLDEDVDDVLHRMVAMLEPLAMFLVGGLMTFFILGVFLPIYGLLNSIH